MILERYILKQLSREEMCQYALYLELKLYGNPETKESDDKRFKRFINDMNRNYQD